ncbi:MAG: HesA/MoeB/ThiF family protein [Nitrososphaerota archaeon]
MQSLSKLELERYDRQIRMPFIGISGQEKIKSSKIVIAGIGGLGCASAIYLAAAGIGELVLIDKEKVELSNLNRQILYWTKDIGKYKVESAKEKLIKLNPEIKIIAIKEEINEENVKELINGANIVIDGQDNFKTRFIINKACVELRIPFVYAAVQGLEGRLMTIIPGKGPCLRCLIPVDPPEVATFPVLGAIPALIAMIQVIEAIKIILGIGEKYIGKLLIFDGERNVFNHVEIKRNPNCPVCKGV